MIKEYIEDLPGGEKFIQAQRGLGIVVGMILGVLIGFSSGLLSVLEVFKH